MKRKTQLLVLLCVVLVTVLITVVCISIKTLTTTDAPAEPDPVPTLESPYSAPTLELPWSILPSMTGMSEDCALKCQEVIGADYYWDIELSPYVLAYNLIEDPTCEYVFKIDASVIKVQVEGDSISYEDLGILPDYNYVDVATDSYDFSGTVDTTQTPDDAGPFWSNLCFTYTPVEDIHMLYNALLDCQIEVQDPEVIYEEYPEDVETYFHIVSGGNTHIYFYATGDTWGINVEE